MLIVKGFVGTELRAVPLAGDVAWLEWWTKSSARELLLGSGVRPARAELRRNSCSRRRRAWEPRNHARASGCRLSGVNLHECISLTYVNCQGFCGNGASCGAAC